MPDENGNEVQTNGRGPWDVVIALIQAVRDILNDWRVASILLIVVLLFAGKVAGAELMEGIESWIRAWRCQP